LFVRCRLFPSFPVSKDCARQRDCKFQHTGLLNVL
jgi:hypothetical protein